MALKTRPKTIALVALIKRVTENGTVSIAADLEEAYRIGWVMGRHRRYPKGRGNGLRKENEELREALGKLINDSTHRHDGCEMGGRVCSLAQARRLLDSVV